MRKGDRILVPRPEGGAFDLRLDERGFMGPQQRKWMFHGEESGLLYALVVANGDHLAGFFQAADGASYNLQRGKEGHYLVARPRVAPGSECGVGRCDPTPTKHPAAEGGLAGPPSQLCPANPAPLGLPPSLQPEAGAVIDMLVVYSVDAAAYAELIGRDIPTMSLLAVELINTSMANSAVQTIEQYSGQDLTNPLNTQCGASAADPTGPNGGFGLPDDCAVTLFSCNDDPETSHSHVSLAMVDPAEADVYLPRVRLIAALEMDGFFGAEEPYDSTGYGVDLDRLANPIDGMMDYVHTWRDSLGADVVMMVGYGYPDEAEGFLGLAFVMKDAITQAHQGNPFVNPTADPPLDLPANPHPIADPFNPPESTLLQFGDVALTEGSGPYFLVDVTGVEDLVPAHELGHTMGCQHDHDNGTPDPINALFPDSYGYPPTSEQGGGGTDSFRTIMAYDGGATRLPGYSNPDREWRNYDGPQDANEAAGLEFDFECDPLDDDGTDAAWIENSGAPCGGEDCEDGDDSMLNGNSPAIGSPDAELEETGQTTANNARTISQTKFDYARFRCSLFEPSDCNNNLIDDFVEAVDGFEADCDQNGVPDSCETVVTDPGLPNPLDCNGNGIPDSCDVLYEISSDENSNGIPDECEDLDLIFREGFEQMTAGFVGGSVYIAVIDPDLVVDGQVVYTDPETGADIEFTPFIDPTDGAAYLATIETVGEGAVPGEGNYIYTDHFPSLFNYALGSNGFFPLLGAAVGNALCFGNHGYGQALVFDPDTGAFPSERGVTTISLATEVASAQIQMNAYDFADLFGDQPNGDTDCTDPLLPQLPTSLCLNEVTIAAYDDADDDPATTDDWGDPVFLSAESFNGTRTPAAAGGVNTPNAMVQRFVVASSGVPELSFDRIQIRGSFIVLDNLGFDLGEEWPDCLADVAGGPEIGGLPTPDGHVDAEDLLVVLATFGLDPTTNALADLGDVNDDGAVDAIDMVEVLAGWGPCAGPPGN